MTKLPDEFYELQEWIKPLLRGRIEDYLVAGRVGLWHGLVRCSFTIFTKEHQYHISAHLPERNGTFKIFKVGKDKVMSNDGYLGCIAETRKPRAGEKWNRGNDLADGSYSKETFDAIIHDILGYELVKVAKPRKEQVDKLPKVK